MKQKTNFMHGSTDETEEIQAYEEIREYLINQGKYSSILEADNDAIERVDYFDSLGIYKEDPQLIAASVHRKKTHALIYAHDLHGVIGENNGFLPDSEQDARQDVDP